MSNPHTASKEDTLCGIAADHGFLNCDKLRAEGKNKDFLDRELRKPDSVTLPKLTAEEKKRAAEQYHRWRLVGIPAPSIRFVHGSPKKPFKKDDELSFLNVSNYVTDQAGADGLQPMPRGYGFNEHGDAEKQKEDIFKIEVVDPGAKSNTVNVTLRAMKPIYAADGSVERHENFAAADPDSNRREIEVECEKVSPTNQVRFRSRYLRLVVDEEDFNALSGGTPQALLITDMADGSGGDNDKIEILDQEVQATYELLNCPAALAGQRKCAVVAQLPIGNNRKRIKLCVHVFNKVAGGNPVGGLLKDMIRKRTMKWFRRAYAQIEMAPKLVGPEIEFVDPPPANMITISQDHGRPVRPAVGGAPPTLTFEPNVWDMPVFGVPVTGPHGGPIPTITVNLTVGWTPQQVGMAIGRALPLGYAADVRVNPRAFTATNGSCDVLITREDGKKVWIMGESTTATGITVDVAKVDIANVQSDLDALSSYIPLTPELRRVVLEAPGTDDRLDFYICEDFTDFWGLGLNPHSDLANHFQPRAPFRWGCFVAAQPMNGTDQYPWVYPHEAGHVLYDAIHVDTGSPHSSTALMCKNVLSQFHTVNATKRITDEPVNVALEVWDPTPALPSNMSSPLINAAQRFRDRSGSVTEAW